MLPEFAIIIPDQIFWGLPIRSRLPQLLRNPWIGRRARHTNVDDFPRFKFDDEEGKERTKEEICDLQEITGPHLCRMIAQERFPALPTGSFGANLLHILLNGPFTDPNIQQKRVPHGCAQLPRVGCVLPSPGSK